MSREAVKRAANEVMYYMERRAMVNRGEPIEGKLEKPKILTALEPAEPRNFKGEEAEANELVLGILAEYGLTKEEASAVLDMVVEYRTAGALAD